MKTHSVSLASFAPSIWLTYSGSAPYNDIWVVFSSFDKSSSNPRGLPFAAIITPAGCKFPASVPVTLVKLGASML